MFAECTMWSEAEASDQRSMVRQLAAGDLHYRRQQTGKSERGF
jgi:hypothetical protein